MPAQNAASGPNSGPTTIEPTIRIGGSSSTPMLAMTIATIMNMRNAADGVDSSPVVCSISCQTTASTPSPGVRRSARSAAADRVGVDPFQHDRAVPLDAQLAQLVQDSAGALADHVAGDQVAGRGAAPRRAARPRG